MWYIQNKWVLNSAVAEGLRSNKKCPWGFAQTEFFFRYCSFILYPQLVILPGLILYLWSDRVKNKLNIEKQFISLTKSLNIKDLATGGGKWKMENLDLVALSFGFSLNLSYVINHACEQKRHSQERGGVSDGNHREKKNIVWKKKKSKKMGVKALWVLLNG